MRVPIFTLNARDNVLLAVVRDYFDLSSDAMCREIQSAHVEVQRILAAKGVPYSELKAALVPRTDRNEAAFIFDSRRIDSLWYGLEAARAVFPLLDKRTTQSVLGGDLIANDQEWLFDILKETLVLARSLKFTTARTCTASI